MWNGPVWPYATSITLTAVANILSDPRLRAYISPVVRRLTESEDQFDRVGEEKEKEKRGVENGEVNGEEIERREESVLVEGEEIEENGEEKVEGKGTVKIIENEIQIKGEVDKASLTDVKSTEVVKEKEMKVLPITKEDYYIMLRQYAMSHTRVREKEENGYKEIEGESDEDVNRVYWLDENLDPETGKFYHLYRLKPCVLVLCVCEYVCLYVYVYVCV